jgi:hypothetical protein
MSITCYDFFNWLAGLEYRDKLTHFEMGKGSVVATRFLLVGNEIPFI